MNIYAQLGLKTIINASDTYTRLGGSRMSEKILAAMNEAGRHFVDIVELNRAVSNEIARLTHNEGAFISSGAAACIVLVSSYLMAGNDPALVKELPDVSKCERNEIIVFHSQTTIPMLPYWHLIELSGAKLIRVCSNLKSLKEAVNPRTAGMFYFLADIYEIGLPPLANVISVMHECGVPMIIDAAAQLPPKENFWRYTRDMGADGIIFSGGKFIMGPQSTGLFLGNRKIAEGCYALTCPNVSVGRPFKVGKEEFVAIYVAVKQFMETDAENIKREQNMRLDIIENAISERADIVIKRINYGRLKQDAPMLVIDLKNGKSGADCAKFMYGECDPAIDIGYYQPDDASGTASQVFINSINLRNGEPEFIAESLIKFLSAM